MIAVFLLFACLLDEFLLFGVGKRGELGAIETMEKGDCLKTVQVRNVRRIAIGSNQEHRALFWNW